jgi:hypothetical protein
MCEAAQTLEQFIKKENPFPERASLQLDGFKFIPNHCRHGRNQRSAQLLDPAIHEEAECLQNVY